MAETLFHNESDKWDNDRFLEENIKRKIHEITPTLEARKGIDIGLHVFDGKSPHSDIARHIEATVFFEFFNNDLEQLKDEYGLYDDSSTFLVLVDYANQAPVGTVRLIEPSGKGLKSLNDLSDPKSPWFTPGVKPQDYIKEIGGPIDKTLDIATMAVMPDYRSGHSATESSAALYSSCVRWSLANGYSHWITIVDKNIFEMMQSWGEPFTVFKDADWAPYIDSSSSIPIHGDLAAGLEKIKRYDEKMSTEFNHKMDIHGLYTRGEGLHAHFLLPNFENSTVK